MANENRVKYATFFILVILIIYAIIDSNKSKNALQNGILVKAKVTYSIMARSGLVVGMRFKYENVYYDKEILLNKDSSFVDSDIVLIKISKEPFGKYIDLVKKVN